MQPVETDVMESYSLSDITPKSMKCDDRGANVAVELVVDLIQNQADLDSVISERHSAYASAFPAKHDDDDDDDDDDGYGSAGSSGLPIDVKSENSGYLFETSFKAETGANSTTDSTPDVKVGDAASMFEILQTYPFMDRTVPDSSLLDTDSLFPTLDVVSSDMKAYDSDLDLVDEIVCRDRDAPYGEANHLPAEVSIAPETESSLPEFNVLLPAEPEQKQTKAALSEGIFSTRDTTDNEENEASDISNDPDDEDYIPPGERRLHRVKRCVPRTRHNSSRKIYKQVPTQRRTRRHSPQLWVFLLESLRNPSLNPSVIAWEDKEQGVFQLTDSKKISKLWGQRSNKTEKNPMDYEKFSRAIRYYYDKGIIVSVSKRLTYQFGPNAEGWRD